MDFETDSTGFITVQIKFMHKHGTVSTYDQDFNLNCTIMQLKEDMQQKLSVPAMQQVWIYKGKKLDDEQTLEDTAVGYGDIIEVHRS